MKFKKVMRLVLTVIIILFMGIVVGRVTATHEEIIVERVIEKEVEKVVESKIDGLAKIYLVKFIDIIEQVAAFPTYEERYQNTLGMKMLASEEYKMWDSLLNEIYMELKGILQTEDMEKLNEQQCQWIAHRDYTAEADGKEYEGGSMQGLIVITSKSSITKERCLELINIYM